MVCSGKVSYIYKQYINCPVILGQFPFHGPRFGALYWKLNIDLQPISPPPLPLPTLSPQKNQTAISEGKRKKR